MKRTLLLMWVLLLGISIQAQTTITLSGGDLQTKYEALEPSPETLIIKGVLNDVDAQFLKSLGCKNILMTDATFVNDAAKAKVSFADNTTVESILLPMDMDEVTSNMFTGCTALGTAVSISSDGKTVRAHSNTAGTLKQTLSQLYLTPNTTNNNNPENNLLGSISQYNYSISKVTDVILSGKIKSEDFSEGLSANDNTIIEHIDLSNAEIEDPTTVAQIGGSNIKEHVKSVILPQSLTTIPNNAFSYCTQLSEVIFSNNLISIGSHAFDHTAITSLKLPSSITYVGDYAFEECDELKDVEMTGLLDSEGNIGSCSFGTYVFASCSALKHVTLSEGTQNIGSNMFYQCGLLESIRIPTTCKTIGSRAFYECYSLHVVTIPEGVEEIQSAAFDLAGLTDLYIMATRPDLVPKIYAIDPSNPRANGSTFSYMRVSGENTPPSDSHYNNGEYAETDYDEIITWYQAEMSSDKGLGTGRCYTAIHYPDNMKPFYEGVNYLDFPNLFTSEVLAGMENYYTAEQYVNLFANNVNYQNYTDVFNKILENGEVTYWNNGVQVTEKVNTAFDELTYIPYLYASDPYKNGSIKLLGPDQDGKYYPNQMSCDFRLVAGATEKVNGSIQASQWGWRQFPLAASIGEIGETPFDKEYDDTWYTMCFPWKMEDNQLFRCFNQKCEIVEFVGAEVLNVDNPATANVVEYSLVFHFDKVAATHYMDNNREYTRERDGNRYDALGNRLWKYTYTSPDNSETIVITCPEFTGELKDQPDNIRAQYADYTSIKNIMVIPGQPYMIHPSIGAAPGHPATVYFDGIKKIAVGEGEQYASYEALAEANKSIKTVSSRTREKIPNDDGTVTVTYSGAEVWTNPETGAGGKYYFIGNINDEVKTVDETTGEETSDEGKQDLPAGCYYLKVPKNSVYPKYYKRGKKGEKLWSQYSAIILPDDDAKDNVEGLNGMTVTSSSGTGLAKGANIELGAWDFDESHIINEHAIATIIEEALEKDPSTPIVHMNVVYNIKGEMVRSDSSSVEGLPKGIYIVNGKKYMVK